MSPSPLAVDGERVYVTAAYQSGGAMFRVKRDGDKFTTETLFEHAPSVSELEVMLMDRQWFIKYRHTYPGSCARQARAQLDSFHEALGQEAAGVDKPGSAAQRGAAADVAQRAPIKV